MIQLSLSLSLCLSVSLCLSLSLFATARLAPLPAPTPPRSARPPLRLEPFIINHRLPLLEPALAAANKDALGARELHALQPRVDPLVHLHAVRVAQRTSLSAQLP
jgi:hypothetical protein